MLHGWWSPAAQHVQVLPWWEHAVTGTVPWGCCFKNTRDSMSLSREGHNGFLGGTAEAKGGWLCCIFPEPLLLSGGITWSQR